MGDDETDSDWREASDWDDPLQVAFLFQDVNASGCGHAVQWNPQRLLDLQCCPICHQPISFIQQGPTCPSDTPTIMFKYGKHIYRLALLLPHPSSSPLPSTMSSSSSWTPLSLLSWWFRGEHQTTWQPSRMLVQDRIQKSLQLADGFKILHKGKIIYPPTSVSSSLSSRKKLERTTSAASASSEEQVSELLLRLSSPSLLLMGTFLGQELSSRSTPTTTTPFRQPWISAVWQLFQWSGSLLYSTIHSVWILVMTSTWNPRQPSLLRGTPPNDNDTPFPRGPSTATGTNAPSNDDNRPHMD